MMACWPIVSRDTSGVLKKLALVPFDCRSCGLGKRCEIHEGRCQHPLHSSPDGSGDSLGTATRVEQEVYSRTRERIDIRIATTKAAASTAIIAFVNEVSSQKAATRPDNTENRRMSGSKPTIFAEANAKKGTFKVTAVKLISMKLSTGKSRAPRTAPKPPPP